VSLLLEPVEGRGELEGPEEVVGLLEVGTDGPDLVDKVLNAGDTVLTEGTIDDAVVGKRNALTVNLTVTSLVDEGLKSVSGRVSVGNVRLNHSDHVDGGSVESDKHAVVELSESQKLHDFLLLGWELVDTSGSDNESDLGLVLNKEVTLSLSLSLGINKSLILSSVLLGVLFSVGSSSLSLLSSVFLSSISLSLQGSEKFGISGLLFLNVLRDYTCTKQNQ